MTEHKPKKFLFQVDDGWRYDRSEVLNYLKGKLDFDIVTYDDLTYEKLRDDFNVIKLERYSPRNILYILMMFFARELDTNINKTIRRIRWHKSPLHIKLFQSIRNLIGRLGLRRYNYYRAHRYLYRKSNKHTDLLCNYRAIVYSPVHTIDKRIVYEAKNMGLSIICWVYSWDNPLKENEFIPDANRYLVWNRETSDLLHRLYKIPSAIVDIVGPVQFDYLLKKQRQPPPKSAADKYIFFTCSVGRLDFYVNQEIQLILMIRQLMDEIDPSSRFVVRPYPAAGEQDAYKALETHDNIEIVSIGSFQGWSTIETTRENQDEKYDQIAQAACLISLGSTIALEASFTDTPIIQLNFNLPNDGPAWQDLKEIYKNEHLSLIIDHAYPNIINNKSELKQALADILAGRTEQYMPYSEKLQHFANPLEVTSYKAVFYEALKNEICAL